MRLIESANRYMDEVEDEELDIAPDEELGSEEDLDSEEGGNEGPEALVTALMDAAPGKEKAIHSMLKYAANSDVEHDIFDDALAYFEENIEGNVSAEEPSDELSNEPAEDDLGADELAAL